MNQVRISDITMKQPNEEFTLSFKEKIELAHAHGIRCNVFWSDDPTQAAEWLDWGMDVILTNDYQRMADALGDRVKTGFIGS